MSTEQNKSVDDGFDELERRPLKSVSIDSVETAFAKALRELTGIDYKVKLNSIDYNPDPNAWYRDMARLDLVAEKKILNPFNGSSGR